MAMGGGRAPGSLSAELNVTPMIDILLVLLIIFLILIPTKPVGESALVPQKSAVGLPTPEATIVIQLHEVPGRAHPIVKINNEVVAWGDLQDRLQRIFLARADKVAFVQGDDDVDFEDVANVIDTARAAGVERVGLVSRNLPTS